jgi:hypothetical protein
MSETNINIDRLVMRDLERSDCTYNNSFPANIDWRNTVVVQIAAHGQGVVLYTCNLRGSQQQCFLPMNFAEMYISRLYIFDV